MRELRRRQEGHRSSKIESFEKDGWGVRVDVLTGIGNIQVSGDLDGGIFNGVVGV